MMTSRIKRGKRLIREKSVPTFTELHRSLGLGKARFQQPPKQLLRCLQKERFIMFFKLPALVLPG